VAVSALALAVALAGPVGSAPPALELARRTLRSASGVTIEAEAGRLTVPENRAVAGSRGIPVGFLRLRSLATTPRAPLFYLAGGPGDRAVSEHPRTLDFWVPFLEIADVVLIDQRGTNDPTVTWRWDGPPPLSFFQHADSATRHVERMSLRALAAFRARGVDLRGYTTVESAADLDDLRAALGMERIALLGFSYGTHLATAYLRRYPERVANAVLIGTEGPDETYKLPWTMDVQLRKIALLAARDSALAGRVPDLVALYDRVVARLAREPLVVTLPGAPGQDSLRVPVGPFGLAFILRADIGDASDLVVLPRLLWSIDRGDPSLLAWFVRKRVGGAMGVHAMNEAMDVASGASPSRQALIAEQAKTSRFADVINFPQPMATAPWGVPDLGEGFRAPLVSSVRTLLISGALDFNTPPYQAERLRWGLTDATHLIVADAGHEQTFLSNETARPVIVDFLRGHDVRERTITYPPLRFVPLEGSDPSVSHPAVPR
jgi:pimeloyl-ACP methyl ester carboxylesterase